MKPSAVSVFVRAVFVGILGFAVVVPVLVLSLYAFSGQWNYPAVLPQSYTLRWFGHVIRYEDALGALGFSVVLATLTTITTAMIGIPAGYALARFRFRGRTAIEMMFLSKTAVPVIVIAIGLATLYFRTGLHDTLIGLLLAHTMGALPYMLWTASAAFEGIDRDLERAARDLGAGFWRTFIEIPLLMALPGLSAGAILVFLFSMDEFTITFLISGVNYTTMPVRLYSTLQQGFLEPASAAALMLLAPSLVYLIICVRFLRPADFAGRAS